MRNLFTALLAASLLSACEEPDEPAPPVEAVDSQSLLDDTFEQLYPMFLANKLEKGPRALLWSHYERRWVRWTGHFVTATTNGAVFKHLPTTTTFDVSVQMDPAARASLKHLKHGQEVTYVAQLKAFDSVFRTFYLIRGRIVEPGHADVAK
jgi:hypothetical protein